MRHRLLPPQRLPLQLRLLPPQLLLLPVQRPLRLPLSLLPPQLLLLLLPLPFGDSVGRSPGVHGRPPNGSGRLGWLPIAAGEAAAELPRQGFRQPLGQ
ncbi:MAG: hypothetical protein ACK52U_06285 [Synechococcaceae cyanobacterium]